jgi:hypothetical protein
MCVTDNFLIVEVAVNDGRACYFTAFKNGHGLGSGGRTFGEISAALLRPAPHNCATGRSAAREHRSKMRREIRSMLPPSRCGEIGFDPLHGGSAEPHLCGGYGGGSTLLMCREGKR